jgi:Metallo-beta-lactamase superfamily
MISSAWNAAREQRRPRGRLVKHISYPGNFCLATNSENQVSKLPMDRSGFLSLPLFWLATLGMIGPFVFSSWAQTCGGEGVAVQVLGSGRPELQDKRASSSYLVWQEGQARVLVDAGGGSALRFGESGAKMSQLDVILFSHFHVDHSADFRADLFVLV